MTYLRAATPSVILLDWMMPVMDGREFLVERSREPGLAAIPVVILTADSTAGHHAAPLGIADHIKKPFEVEFLLQAIRVHSSPAS